VIRVKCFQRGGRAITSDVYSDELHHRQLLKWKESIGDIPKKLLDGRVSGQDWD
jgi:hypothetical protein